MLLIYLGYPRCRWLSLILSWTHHNWWFIQCKSMVYCHFEKSYDAKWSVWVRNWTLFTILSPVFHSLRQMCECELMLLLLTTAGSKESTISNNTSINILLKPSHLLHKRPPSLLSTTMLSVHIHAHIVWEFLTQTSIYHQGPWGYHFVFYYQIFALYESPWVYLKIIINALLKKKSHLGWPESE